MTAAVRPALPAAWCAGAPAYPPQRRRLRAGSACEKYDPTNGYCTQPGGRDAEGRLIPDPLKFPDGMKAVADYVHSVGAKFGMYTAIGPITCSGYEGSAGHEAIDAATFASWWASRLCAWSRVVSADSLGVTRGVDFLKHDYCNANVSDVLRAVPAMRVALDQANRSIVYYVDADTTERVYDPQALTPRYAQSWKELPWMWAPQHGVNMWKTWKDIKDTW